MVHDSMQSKIFPPKTNFFREGMELFFFSWITPEMTPFPSKLLSLRCHVSRPVNSIVNVDHGDNYRVEGDSQ